MIDLSLKEQYLHGFYIYRYKDRVTFGKYGTDNHFCRMFEDFKDLESLKIEILKTIRRCEMEDKMTEKERYEEENECALIEIDDMQEFLQEIAFERGVSYSPYTCDDFDEIEIDGVYYFIYDKL